MMQAWWLHKHCADYFRLLNPDTGTTSGIRSL